MAELIETGDTRSICKSLRKFGPVMHRGAMFMPNGHDLDSDGMFGYGRKTWYRILRDLPGNCIHGTTWRETAAKLPRSESVIVKRAR